MSAPSANPASGDPHASVYDGLLGDNDAHWAFGSDFEDPLAGVDTSIPEGVEGADLAAYSLMLGDDALVMSQRLSEWCSRAPDLEEDIALANMALDLLGQARLLLARAGAADPSSVPTLPEGSPVPAEDALAFFRDDQQLRNVRLAEVDNGDFAHVIVRVLIFASWRLALLHRLSASRDLVLAAIAAKGVKELTYHRDFAARWFLTLARGTDESRRRLLTALDELWPLYDELFETHEVESRLSAVEVAVPSADARREVDAVLDQVFAVADAERPDRPGLAGVRGRKGRDGMHTEALSRMLAEMQSVARAHPRGLW